MLQELSKKFRFGSFDIDNKFDYLDSDKNLRALICPLHKNIVQMVDYNKETNDLRISSLKIIYNYSNTTLEDILKQIPSKWTPDVIICRDILFYPPPIGIEQSEYPTIGIIGDWNINFTSVISTIHRFNYLFCDRKGVEVLKQSGITNIDYWPNYGLVPQIFKPIENIEKIYDICFVGSLDHNIQKERSIYLKRIALLSDKYKVIILTGLYREDYVKVLNQSKICFNHSVRGEMNMRAFEVPACKSLLFIEEDNLEVRDFYEDKKHCVFYNNDNFENLIKYYLDNEEERNEIIEAAYIQVQKYTYKEHLKLLIRKISDLNLEKIKKIPRKCLGLSKIEFYKNMAYSGFKSVISDKFKLVNILLEDILEIKKDADILNAIGVVTANKAINYGELVESLLLKSKDYFLNALEYDNNCAIIHFNLANVYLYLEEFNEAENKLIETIILLESKDVEDSLKVRQFYFPYRLDKFTSEWEQIHFKYFSNKRKLLEKLRDLLLWKTRDILGDIYKSQDNLFYALSTYEKALENMPSIGFTRYKYAKVLELLGNFDEAIVNYKQSIKDDIFQIECWKDLAYLLKQRGELEECRNFSKECLKIIRTYSPFKDLEEYFLQFI